MNIRNGHRARTLITSLVAVAFTAPALGQVRNEDFKLIANDGTPNETFGYSVAVDNGIVAVGAISGHNTSGVQTGSAYLYDAMTGTQLLKLLASDGAPLDNFGWSIAISNGIVVVGAPGDDDNGQDSGSVYLFDATTGAQMAKILAQDGMFQDSFGRSVAIDEGVVAVGADFDDTPNGDWSGSAYIYSASTGALVARLIPEDGGPNDHFGSSIAIDNGLVAVGSPWDDERGANAGSIYVFDVNTGSQVSKVFPDSSAGAPLLGYGSIAINNGKVAAGIVGSPLTVYVSDAHTGARLVTFSPSDGDAPTSSQAVVSMSDGLVAVGAAFNDGSAILSGSAYVFDANTGVQIRKLLPSDGTGTTTTRYGSSIGIHEGIIVVGRKLDNNSNGDSAGSAYVFNVTCPADFTGDYAYDFFDVSAFLTFFSISNPVADWNADGVFDFFDVMAYLADFAAGCP